MSVDYIVSSLPVLAFGAAAPLSWQKFTEASEGRAAEPPAAWKDLETQLRNAVAEARGGAKYKRRAQGCSIYWKNRVTAAFQEKDVAKRDEMLDKVWWDAAGELVPPADPLGLGALHAYAIRLKIAIRRSAISQEAGNNAFDALTAETKIEGFSTIQKD